MKSLPEATARSPQIGLSMLSPTLPQQAPAIDTPGWSIGSFSVSGTPPPLFPHAPLGKAFPARRIVRPPQQNFPQSEFLEAWAAQLGLEPVLGPLIVTADQRLRVLRLLYQYRHLNREDLRDLPCTDLVTHRVRIAPGTKPASSKFQKRWPAHTEWWLRKLVQDGLEGGVYELTEPANGRLSQWNARAVMVDKVENSKPSDEPRMTFDYSRATELLPGSHLELSSKVHDHLSNPCHGCLFSADLKHAYLTIPLHPDDRHYFSFTISGIGQIQPTRMQQGSQSAGFTMTELAYRAFGAIPAPMPEPSLLHSADPTIPPPLTFYMDDFFGGFKDFEDLFYFLKHHFFPRVEWAKLLLSFKKLRLFASAIKALGVIHRIGGRVYILEERIAKIARWPEPTDQSEVRGFLGTVGITRRWVKNFAEIARPLSRLTGKNTVWKWTQAEQLSFEIVRIKCATRTSMHGIDMNLVVHFYTDASGFALGCAVTQFQPASWVDVIAPQAESPTTQALTIPPRKSIAAKDVEVPILYDSFPLSVTQRKYPTYKRELCAIATFCKKYDYLCKHPYKPAIVHRDHKPLTHFLSSDLHEGVYGHWADQLRRLNISIQYIPGPRNKAADGLSRTIFDSSECDDTPAVIRLKKKLDSKGPQWVWKDGKGGYEEFVDSLTSTDKDELITQGTVHGIPAFAITTEAIPSWVEAYLNSEWYSEIYRLLSDRSEEPPMATLLRKAFNYRINNEILWIHRHADTYLPCIPESKVLPVLREAHDLSGHWAKTGTMARLRNLCYWPGQSQDVEKYIAGCLVCAQHGPATRSQPLSPVVVTYPFQLMGMDFIGPLETTSTGYRYILNTGCYMSRFSVPFACENNNVEDVIRCLGMFFAIYRKPYAYYVDPGHHFDCDELREFLRREGIAIAYSPSASHKSTGMIEVMNRVLEGVVRKLGKEWDRSLVNAGSSINSRVISYLGTSPKSIVLGPLSDTSPITAALRALPGRDIPSWAALLQDLGEHRKEVQTYLRHRAEVHDVVRALALKQKEYMAVRYNKSVKQVVHHVGSLVMLYQEKAGKLAPRWRGPFRISGFGGAHGRSFTLLQLNGRRIRGVFHGDHLKSFVPRSGYLSDLDASPVLLPQQQNTRRTRITRRERPGLPLPPLPV